MKKSPLLFVSILAMLVLTACSPTGLGKASIGSTPSSTSPASTPASCANPMQVIDAFYAANDASRFDESVSYLTDDVTLVTWAEGANGHHMTANFAVGKDDIREFLSHPGLRMKASQEGLPNYTRQEVQVTDGKVQFKLVPDRPHPDGRPYNPYAVEVVFSGCKIEMLKVVERVSWL